MKLFGKIYAAVLIVLLLVILPFSYIVTTHLIVDAERHLTERFSLTGDLVAQDIEHDYKEFGWDFEQLRNLTRQRDFLFWWLVKPDGIIHLADQAPLMGTSVKDYFPHLEGKKFDQKETVLNRRQNYGTIIIPCRIDREQWLFFLGFSLEKVLAVGNRIVFLSFLGTALFLGLLGVLLFGIIRHFIGPLRDLTQAAAVLGRGNLSHRVEAVTPDEVGELARAFNQMAQNLEQQAASLKEKDEHLRQAQKMEAVGQLAGGVAHDFNNILTAISGYSELLLMQLPPGSPEHLEAQEIRHAAERAASLTRQLLAFSRKQVVQPRALNLNQVITSLEGMLRRVLGEDIDLAFSLGEGLGLALADPGQMEQVILNLAVNARDAMSRGGKLTLETADVDLDEAYARTRLEVEPGPYVMLAVSDTGIGIDQETRSRIFEPFFTTKELGKGTGLGLSTVYGIVKQNRGHIWVYSEPLKGACFKIYLPRMQPPAIAVEIGPPSVVLPRGQETVLLVEDDAEVRMVVSKMLARQGYRVLEAAGGREALKVCNSHPEPVHLILTDVVMPGMSGPELAGLVIQKHQEIKVLFMSGHTENDIVHPGVLEPGVAFIQKPFKYNDLICLVREVLDRAGGYGGGKPANPGGAGVS